MRVPADTSSARTYGPELLFAAAVLGLGTGGVARALGHTGVAGLCWMVVTAAACLPAIWWVADGLRRGRFGSDVIAVLALAGTLAVGEYLAGAVIAVMLTGGQLLERRAGQRARRDLGALLSLAPKVAHRRQDGTVVTIDVAQVCPGDVLMVGPGEVVPVDGRVEHGSALIDESTVTGEPLPVPHERGAAVLSGTVNSAGPFDLRATRDAGSSTYAGIVRLARDAASASSPFVRMADRYALAFLPLTLLLAGGAWLASADPVRAVAVLVVATPCPLILAAPVAFVSGLSRCARRGVVVKSGAALEALAKARVLLFDKTGTVTFGRPSLSEVVAVDPDAADEQLRLAASLEQFSPHVLATSVVRAAQERGFSLTIPTEVSESTGYGVQGFVDGHTVRVGKADWCGAVDPGWLRRVRARAAARGVITVFVGVDDRLTAVLLLVDRVRPDAAMTFRLLRRAGIERTVMVTGDQTSVAVSIARLVGADQLHAEQTPADKVAVAHAESAKAPTVMVGDGVNDAPALAAAGVGVALGSRGATASSEVADVVITIDRLERLAETMTIARRTRTIARQSVLLGMGLSLAAMVAAAFGLLTPAVGAVVQEGIDVAAILGALRALGSGRRQWPHLHGDDAQLVHELGNEHRQLWPKISALPTLAERLAELSPDARRAAVSSLNTFLDDLTAHEVRDERLLYPAVARALGGTDPTGAMSRGHAEIAELARRVRELSDQADRDQPQPEVLRELRGVIHELYAVLRLHFAQEEENYFVLADTDSPPDH